MEFSKETLNKNRIFEDLYNGKQPERVPIFSTADNAFCLEYAGFNLKTEQYSIDKNLEAIKKATMDFECDAVFGLYSRFPHFYKILGATNFVPGADGFIQHPEVSGLEVDEYDAFIADPMKVLWDKVLPRIYTVIGKGGFESQKAVSKAFTTLYTTLGKIGANCTVMANELGKSTYSFVGAVSCAPFDVLADQLRSFSGISTDVRRCPDKVEAAAEALLPLALKAGILPTSNRYVRTMIPLHMGPYMREKDFKRLYWPTFKAFVEGMDKAGVGANIIVEQDWMRYLDYLNELPENTTLMFEYGDAKIIKEKVGKRHIVSGLYPLGILKTGTERECLDKAKELIDILAPGGKYAFGFDKSLLRINDVNVDNLKAVLSFVKDYGKY
ncbi:uroporphyrinogen decarboxylase [Acetobacterium carbinolicum]|uniref:uroporphyrinogen decarboxylase n=1 Tax=Acetobacterium carbinolicum TaxID=52690 RepID=UPI003BF4BD7F